MLWHTNPGRASLECREVRLAPGWPLGRTLWHTKPGRAAPVCREVRPAPGWPLARLPGRTGQGKAASEHLGKGDGKTPDEKPRSAPGPRESSDHHRVPEGRGTQQLGARWARRARSRRPLPAARAGLGGAGRARRCCHLLARERAAPAAGCAP